MAQYSRHYRDYLPQEKTNFEVKMMADQYGATANWVPEFTSKNRLKVSDSQTVFYNTFQYGKETDTWDEFTANGGTATHDPTTSSVTMTVTNTLGSKVIRQTKTVMPYIPSRTSTLSFGIRLGLPTTGIRRRFGLWDGNDGAYFEDGGDGNYYCCIANSNGATPTLERIPREDWTGDKLDGNGRSGITADPEAQQLIEIEYDWYGSGNVNFRFIINGESHVIHTFRHANRLNTVWCKTPFLPIRCEIENTTGGQSDTAFNLHQGSNSKTSDGTTQRLGTFSNVASPITGKTLAVANTFYPVLSIRLKSTALQGVVIPRRFQVATIDNTSVFYKILVNGTLASPSWQDMEDSNSFTQYETAATGITGGIPLYSGFVIGGSNTPVEFDLSGYYQLGRSSLGTVSDILTIAAATSNTNKNALASLSWIEQR
jgi:hypothetical protein